MRRNGYDVSPFFRSASRFVDRDNGFRRAESPRRPQIVAGYSIGMSTQDMGALSAQNSLSVFNKAPISTYTQIVYNGKLEGFSNARLFTIVAGGKLVNINLGIKADDDAEAAKLKARHSDTLNEGKKLFGEPESLLEGAMLEWQFGDRKAGVFYDENEKAPASPS